MAHSASARVTINLEISVGAVWGAEATVAQVHKQAAEEAMHVVADVISNLRRGHAVRTLGEPKVTAILATKEPG
jgi:hypothetical protein